MAKSLRPHARRPETGRGRSGFAISAELHALFEFRSPLPTHRGRLCSRILRRSSFFWRRGRSPQPIRHAAYTRRHLISRPNWSLFPSFRLSGDRVWRPGGSGPPGRSDYPRQAPSTADRRIRPGRRIRS